MLISTGLLCGVVLVSHFVSKLFSKNKYEQCIYDYTLVIPNYGYMGYALSEALLGQAGLMNFMTFAIPVSLYTYSVGFAKLTKQGISLKKLCNPVIISMVLGIVVGLTGIKLPDICNDVIDKSASCMAPASMLLTGIVISGFPLKNLLCSGKNYIMVALRLLGIPLVMGGILRLFGDAQLVQTAVLFYALPCGLNTVVFPKLIDENCEIGAGLAFISNILACATIPLVFALFGIG